MEASAVLTPLANLNKDLREAAKELTAEQSRYLVDAYYAFQIQRIALHNQSVALEKSEEPNATTVFFESQARKVEDQIKRVLDHWTDADELSMWAKSIVGIGPVLSAGLAAHIDLDRTNSAGGIWRFAGLDPTSEWKKGQRRPWNARLKVIAWKIGESFMKVSGNPKDFYGHIYAERKAWETERNEKLEYADQAKAKLKDFNIGKDTEAYKAYEKDMLPLGRIHERAKRYATKLFLAHYFEVGCEIAGRKAPIPWPILHTEEHAHYIMPPNWGGRGSERVVKPIYDDGKEGEPFVKPW